MLVLCVLSLTGKTLQLMKGNHSKKTLNFVKACFAFCHITVPSVSDVILRLRLLLHCAEYALLNRCLPQTDTFLKAAISLYPDIPVRKHLTLKVLLFSLIYYHYYYCCCYYCYCYYNNNYYCYYHYFSYLLLILMNICIPSSVN